MRHATRTRQHRAVSKLLSVALVATLPFMLQPVSAQPLSAVRGTVVDQDSGNPVVGARLHLMQFGTGVVFASGATDTEGAFDLSGLPVARYEAAVEFEGGLYVVANPVIVTEDGASELYLAIPQLTPGQRPATPWAAGSAGFLSSPVATTLLVVGSALSVGRLVKKRKKPRCENAPEHSSCPHDDPASPF